MFIEAAVLSFLVALVRRGRIDNIVRIKFRHVELLFLSFLIQFALDWVAGRGYPWVATVQYPMHLVSYALLFWAVYLNRYLGGVLTMGAGSLLNLLVIALNGAMPVATGHMPEKLLQSFRAGHQAIHMLQDKSTLLPWLGDIFYVPYPMPAMISVGDIVISLGIFIFVQKAMATGSLRSYKITEVRPWH